MADSPAYASTRPGGLIRPLLWTGCGLALLFATVPGVDLAFSRGFYQVGAGFPAAEDPLALAVRDVFRLSFNLVAVATALLLVQALLPGRPGLRIPVRIWAFMAAAQAVGPGLLANALLKENWGRARPDHVAEFGGDSAMSPAFVISDACTSNCSFVSGEATAAATVAMLAAVLVLPRLPHGHRRWFGSLLGLAVALPALLRVAMGRHFLSDVVFGGLLGALAVLCLYRLLGIEAVRDRVTAANLWADIAGGWRALRALAVRWRGLLRTRPRRTP